MIRLIGVFVSAGIVLPMLFAAQDREVDQIGQEGLRLMNAQAEELEAMAKNPDRKNLVERDKKLQKILDAMGQLETRVKKLSPDSLMSLKEKYGKDLALAEERCKTARAKLGIKDVPDDPKQPQGDAKKEGPKTESPQDIAKRIQENMKKATERLKMNDTGKETLQTQDDIIKDLEELLKQKNPDGGGGGGGGGGGANNNQGGGGSSGSGGNSGGNNNKSGNGGQGGQGGGNDQKNPTGNKDEQPKGGDQKPEPNNGGGGAGKPNEKGGNGGLGAKGLDGKTVNPDTKLDEWGQLPKTKRQEMETYARDQFMRRYENDLRQYYRAIAEQSRRD